VTTQLQLIIIIIIIIIITIIIIINCNWVITRWQWLFYMYTNNNNTILLLLLLLLSLLLLLFRWSPLCIALESRIDKHYKLRGRSANSSKMSAIFLQFRQDAIFKRLQHISLHNVRLLAMQLRPFTNTWDEPVFRRVRKIEKIYY